MCPERGMENDLQWIIYVLERAYLGNDTLPGNVKKKVGFQQKIG